jgi:hypothetical protein
MCDRLVRPFVVAFETSEMLTSTLQSHTPVGAEAALKSQCPLWKRGNAALSDTPKGPLAAGAFHCTCIANLCCGLSAVRLWARSRQWYLSSGGEH